MARKKEPTKMMLARSGLQPDEIRWRQWIINKMTNHERHHFAAHGYPLDPRPFAPKAVVDEALALAESGYFKNSKPKDAKVQATEPTWFEKVVERFFKWIRDRLRR